MSVKSTEFRKDNFKGYWKEEENHRVLKTLFLLTKLSFYFSPMICHVAKLMSENFLSREQNYLMLTVYDLNIKPLGFFF